MKLLTDLMSATRRWLWLIAVAGGLWSASAAAAVVPGIVQNAYAQQFCQTLQCISVTFPQQQTTGNLNLVIIGWADSTSHITSVTDTGGNTYTPVFPTTVIPGQASQAFYYAKNIVGIANTTTTVFVTFDQYPAAPDVRIAEYSGLDLMAPVDVAVASTGNGALSSSGSVTTTNAADLLVAANDVFSPSTGAGSGYVLRQITPTWGDVLEDQMVGTTASYSATAPISTSGWWIMQLVALKRTSSAAHIVQSAFAQVPCGSLNCITATFPQTETSGDTNMVIIGWADSTSHVTSVSDSLGNAYTLAVGPTILPGSSTQVSLTQAFYYAKGIKPSAGSANTVFVRFDAFANGPDVRIAEYNGIDPIAPLDVAVAGTGSSTLSNSGPVTTTNAADILVAANDVIYPSTGAGYSFILEQNTLTFGDILEDTTVLSIGTYSATAPLSAAGPWIMQMVAFKAQSSSGNVTPPTAPTSLSGSGDASLVNLTWTASTSNTGVTGYLIERCSGASCTLFAQIGTSIVASYSDSGLAPGTSYSYRVRATDAYGNMSGYSNTFSIVTSAALTAPSGLVVVAASSAEVDLAWTASSGGAGSITYSVESCSGANCSSFSRIGASSSTNFNMPGLTASTSYSFRVRAGAASGDLSTYSSVVSYTTPAATPDCKL